MYNHVVFNIDLKSARSDFNKSLSPSFLSVIVQLHVSYVNDSK